jgi:hypothetical protein
MRTKSISILSAALAAAVLAAPMPGVAQPGRTQAAAPQPPNAGVVKGKVLEKLEGGGYTYLLIAQGSEKVWSAVPAAEVKVGDEVTVEAQALMGNYKSPTLKRTFDKVYFGELRTGATAASTAPAAGAKPAGHPDVPLPTAAPAYADAQLKGKVLEVLQVPGYTYLRLATQGGETWAAVPTTEVPVGTEVGVHGAAEMGRFESKSLKRTFDKISFGSALSLKQGAKPAAGHP